MNPAAETYTIFKDPLDLPGYYVVRRFEIYQSIPEPVAGPILGIVKTYEEAVALVPPGSYNLGRHKNDHPSVVETWI